MSLKTIRNFYLAFCIIFQMVLVLESIVYLGVKSGSFVLVVVAGVISSVVIVYQVWKYDETSKTSYE